MSPFISICIPTYKNASFFKRLMDSIVLQDFKKFEVIISDDSPDDSIAELIAEYQNNILELKYIKNDPAKGMPENWNAAIKVAKGTWIKIMHDDDWFESEQSLSHFAKVAQNEAVQFIFSDYINQDLHRGTRQEVKFSKFKLAGLLKNPLKLMAGNQIGPPSVCMVHRDLAATYNGDLHWLVDIDYYIQIFMQTSAVFHIASPLINIGVNLEQITKAVKNNPEIEIGEAKKLLDNYGTKWVKDLGVYDGWWRLFRNMHIRSENELVQYGGANWPSIFSKMVKQQSMLPVSLLKIGPFSKFFMFVSYLLQGSNLK